MDGPSNKDGEDHAHCGKDIEQLKLQVEETDNCSQKPVSQERFDNGNMIFQSTKLPKTVKLSRPWKLISLNSGSNVQTVGFISRHRVTQQLEDTIEKGESEKYPEQEEDRVGVIDFNTTARISRKIRLSNHFINRLRGHFKIVIDAPIHLIELCVRNTHASDAIVQVVKQGLARQKQASRDNQITNNSFQPAFAEIVSGWTYEGKNADRGFSSPSIWMRDPHARRILVKTQDHPLSAANEWLAYALGKLIGLPVNEVQIAIYQNNLVTLHIDVSHETEKAVSFMDLPKQIRKILSTNPIMGCMDLFDFIIQNVDRNPQNILITVPNTTAVNENKAEMRVHLIDHSACFGMGKLNIISIMASKIHSQHLAVVKFDPKERASKFEQYLNQLPIADRIFIGKTLSAFADINDDQFSGLMTEVQDLLSTSQYNRILDVLHQQRDIARHYTIQWGMRSTIMMIYL